MYRHKLPSTAASIISSWRPRNAECPKAVSGVRSSWNCERNLLTLLQYAASKQSEMGSGSDSSRRLAFYTYPCPYSVDATVSSIVKWFAAVVSYFRERESHVKPRVSVRERPRRPECARHRVAIWRAWEVHIERWQTRLWRRLPVAVLTPKVRGLLPVTACDHEETSRRARCDACRLHRIDDHDGSSHSS